jgi:hypothetical protein
MFSESRPGDSVAQQCRYCGALLRTSLTCCPQCGASQRIGPEGAAPARESAPPVVEDRPREPLSAPSIAADRLREPMGRNGAGAKAHFIDYEAELQKSHRSRLPFHLLGGVVVGVFVLVAFLFLHRERSETASADQAVQGSILAAQNAPAGPTAAQGPVVHTVPFVAASVPAASAPLARNTNMVQQGNTARGSNGAEHARPDVARDLASARLSLDRNRLWPARRAITSALAAQPDNAEAQQMRAELAAREQQRDSLLRSARQCAREDQWSCARQNAGHALTVDASSQEAKKLLARASAGRGAGNEGSGDAGPDSTDADQ